MNTATEVTFKKVQTQRAPAPTSAFNSMSTELSVYLCDIICVCLLFLAHIYIFSYFSPRFETELWLTWLKYSIKASVSIDYTYIRINRISIP